MGYYCETDFEQPNEQAPPKKTIGRRGLMSGLLRGAAVATGASLGLIQLASATGAASFPTPVSIPPAGRLLSPTAEDRHDWALFKARFLAADGRVIDTGNRHVSHTEGQGLGMLFAASFGDRATFDLIHGWTSAKLRASNGLHAWRWIAEQPDHVRDPNNATDGDIAIAAALQRAARRWQSQAYAQAASDIAAAILARCVTSVAGQTVLLPGQTGFSKPDHVVVNPSYYIFPLIPDLAEACPSPLWNRIAEDGAAMIAKARFGRWHLPADWLQIRRSDGAISLAESFPARFSYDAVRVPLFLAWAGVAPEVVASVSNFWTGHCPGQPNWVDLKTDNPAGPLYLRGAQSIATFIGRVPVPSLQARPHQVRSLQAVAAAPAPDAAGDSYYSAALSMMTRLAHHAVSNRNAGNPVSS